MTHSFGFRITLEKYVVDGSRSPFEADQADAVSVAEIADQLMNAALRVRKCVRVLNKNKSFRTTPFERADNFAKLRRNL